MTEYTTLSADYYEGLMRRIESLKTEVASQRELIVELFEWINGAIYSGDISPSEAELKWLREAQERAKAQSHLTAEGGE